MHPRSHIMGPMIYIYIPNNEKVMSYETQDTERFVQEFLFSYLQMIQMVTPKPLQQKCMHAAKWMMAANRSNFCTQEAINFWSPNQCASTKTDGTP